ncbi:unnamed protein product [Rotaria magnacalcarata]|uniref:Uncharacterized protein n=1 Tax=Rotaria magnacalcarata TaxID=392030 RepID=A0A819D698_9BILA|nr:unnamed protein product [Rotaria magnacalcarata]CAF2272992.1 unnamed protein product [Rotaria magnacalcarata]CAF3829429.1 unnamed protein product [Rotaria magnacalcarata]CAF4012224.1 unnamed protein product [Rotaria magnacalcarata]
MYHCIIPPRVFLALGVGLLIFGLVLGWISFSVPDWLQYYERNSLNNITKRDSNNGTIFPNDVSLDLKKFGLWLKCIYSTKSNDFVCASWNKDAPSFVGVAQVLIPCGLTLECLALLSAFIGFLSRRAFVTTVLFAALFAFLSFIFTTIGVTVFATESLVYVERFRLNNNENPRRWAMWLFIPNLILSFLASLCFILASIFNWCDYRTMKATGILSHAVDKYAGSVFKAPSESTNITSGTKKHQYLHQQQMNGQDYPNTCYQLNGSKNNQNTSSYPPPPSYGAPMNQHSGNGPSNPAFQTTQGLFGYSRPPSPIYPHSNLDPYQNRNFMTENSEMDEASRASGSRRHSRSYRRSSRRSRTRSPHENETNGNNNNQNNNNNKQPQFIPIPIPYYHPPMQQQQQQQQQQQPPISQPMTQTFNTLPNNNTNINNQPVSYIIQPPKQQFMEEFIQPKVKPSNMLTYCSEQPSVLLSNPKQPVYTIAYRTNNGGNLMTSNILTGPAATTYVTAARDQIAELNSPNNNNSDDEDNIYRNSSRSQTLKKIKANEAWTWRKL